jgi:hypothetical protein
LRVRFSPRAHHDLRSAIEYVAARNPTAAAELTDQFLSTIEKLAQGEFQGIEVQLRSGAVVSSWDVISTPPGRTGTAASDPALSLFERRLHLPEGFRIAAPIWVGGQGALTKGALEVVGRRARRDAKDLPDRGRGRRRRGRWPDAGAGAISGADAPGRLTEEHPGPGARPERLDLDQPNRRGASGLCQRLVAGSRAARKRVGLAKGFARRRCRPPGDP